MNVKPIINNCLPVPLGFNLPQNRLPIDVYSRSDTFRVRISLYEYHGLYWYCFEYVTDMNSIGFVGLRNCVASLRDTLKSLGFSIYDSDGLTAFVREAGKSFKTLEGVA